MRTGGWFSLVGPSQLHTPRSKSRVSFFWPVSLPAWGLERTRKPVNIMPFEHTRQNISGDQIFQTGNPSERRLTPRRVRNAVPKNMRLCLLTFGNFLGKCNRLDCYVLQLCGRPFARFNTVGQFLSVRAVISYPPNCSSCIAPKSAFRLMVGVNKEIKREGILNSLYMALVDNIRNNNNLFSILRNWPKIYLNTGGQVKSIHVFRSEPFLSLNLVQK